MVALILAALLVLSSCAGSDQHQLAEPPVVDAYTVYHKYTCLEDGGVHILEPGATHAHYGVISSVPTGSNILTLPINDALTGDIFPVNDHEGSPFGIVFDGSEPDFRLDGSLSLDLSNGTETAEFVVAAVCGYGQPVEQSLSP
jgi:hypothetical protein